jgi:hypothetical protein
MPEPTGLMAIHVRPGNPDFLDLPWDTELARWPQACGRSVELQRGLSRHEVQFVSYGTAMYALKELPSGLAEREYGLLVEMQGKGLPVVDPVGHALARRTGGEAVSVLVTRFLDGSHPYRVLFLNAGLERYRERLLDAMAGLLVRLHLAGAYWGDCSLSNTLFRRDAGQLGAYLVDAETSEVHETLSDGQRRMDLMILEENVCGDLFDIAVVAELPEALRPEDIGETITRRYEGLWAEVNRELIVGVGERWRIQERIRALNALGFSVAEIELIATGDRDRLRMRTLVTDRDYHRHHLHDLTGQVALERQAELILNEIHELKARLSRELNRSVPLAVAAFRWQSEMWEPTVTRLAPLLRGHGDAAELYCQVLEHKWFLSEQAQQDVGLERALEDYLARAPGSAKP